MTILSTFYDGTVTEIQWAKGAAYLGRTPCVADAAAWKVTAVVGPDRTVRVATGVGYGYGVLDTSDTTVDVQLAIVASGTRWDAVVARRDWTLTPGGTTTFVAVAGTAAQALPAGLLVNPGVSADQVLALVQVTAGQSTPTAVIDMRPLPLFAVTYPNVTALPADAAVGSTAMVAGRQFDRIASGWVPSGVFAEAAGLASGFSAGGLTPGAPLNASIAFPVGKFTVPPIVTVSSQSAPAGAQRVEPRAINVTVGGFTITCYNTGTETVAFAGLNVAWQAMQMTSTTAGG